jgi:hypothetical protein
MFVEQKSIFYSYNFTISSQATNVTFLQVHYVNRLKILQFDNFIMIYKYDIIT